MAGGWPMLPILLCSAIMLAIVLERFWSLRHDAVLPPGLDDEVRQWARSRRLDTEHLKALADGSPLGELFAAALGVRERSREIIKERIEDTGRHVVHRMERRNAAMAKAVALTLPFLLFWLLGSWVIGSVFGGDGGTDDGTTSVGLHRPAASGLTFGVLAVVSVAAWAVQCGSEVLLARTQGADYLPHGPWAVLSGVLGAGGRGLSTASQTMSGAARRTGRRGCGCVLAAATVPLLLLLLLIAALTSVVSVLWILFLVAVPAVHVVSVGMRLHHWRQARTIGGTP